jgi:predicted nucleic acid-binding Zn ribbon protein
MTPCPSCGSPVAADDAFCGSCGAFLDWAATPATGEPDPAAEPGPVPEPAPDGVANRDDDQPPARAVGGAGGTPAAGAVGGERETPAARAVGGAGGTPAAGAVGGERETPAGDADATPRDAVAAPSRAAALVVPVPEPGAKPAAPVAATPAPVADPDADQPRAVQPGRPVAPRPVVRDFSAEPAEGDLVCPHCGTVNPAGRSFCRRCGKPLVPEAEPVKARRRRRWPRFRFGGLRRLLAVVVVLALIAAAVLAALRWGPGAVEAVRDKLAKPALTPPSAVTASSSAKGHAAEAVADGLNNRYWAPATDRPAKGQYVELTFETPIRVLDLIVHAGASPQQDQFVEQARPADVTLVFFTEDGKRTDRPLHLADRPGPQTFHEVHGGVSRIRLVIGTGYGIRRGHAMAVAEIEVFRRP